MIYEIFHDESKNAGYWHGMLLVPLDKKEALLNLLKDIRTNLDYHEPISLKKVNASSGKIFKLARAWTHIGVASLIQNLKGDSFQIYTEESRDNRYGMLDEVLGCKFILFRELDNHAQMELHADYGSKVETTCRMGLKGGLHFLFDPENPAHIIKVYFDGSEHYNRGLDKSRLIDRMTGLREYVSFEDHDNLIDDRTSNHKKTNPLDYDNCQLVQLTDLLVGSFRTILGEKTRDVHTDVAYPVNEIIERYIAGPARMKNSRWHRGFCMSQCNLENDAWNFSCLEPEPPENNQLGLGI